MNEILLSSKKHDYETPVGFFDLLDNIFNFYIDLAANQKNSKCKLFIGEEQNSLSFNWNLFNNVWCWLNPPYGRQISKWVKKSFESKSNICMLIPSRTDTNWQHNYVFRSNLIIFIKGRLKFGNEKNSAPFPSQLVFFGEVKKTNRKIKKIKHRIYIKAKSKFIDLALIIRHLITHIIYIIISYHHLTNHDLLIHISVNLS